MSRTRRVVAGAALGYANMAVTTLAGLWFTPFLLRHIGQQSFGLWAVSAPILSYLGMIDFGVISLFQREVAHLLGAAGGDFRASPGLPIATGKVFRLVLWQVPALCAAATTVWLCLPKDWEPLRGPFGIVLASLVVFFPVRISHALLMGLQDLAFIGKLNILAWLAGFVIGVVLVLLGHGLYGLAISWSASQLIANTAYCLRVFFRFRDTLPRHLPRLSRTEAMERLGRGFWIVITQLASAVMSGGDVLVVGATMGPAAVAPYAITDKLVTMFYNIPQQLMASAQPALSELKAAGDRQKLGVVCTALTQAVLLVSGLIACLVIVVDQGFVDWWVGKAQFAGNSVVVLLVAGMLLSHWTTSTIYTIFSFGYERLISITSIVNGILTLGLTILLTRRFGFAGAAAASSVGLLVVALPPHLVAISRQTATAKRVLLGALWPWAWRFGLLVVCAVMAARLWIPDSFFKLAVTSVAVTIVYAGTMFPVVMSEPLGSYVRPRIAVLQQRLAKKG